MKRGFKTGKDNPKHKAADWRGHPAYIQGQKDMAEQRLRSSHAQDFANRVGHNIMILLSQRPFNEWPDIAKLAYAHERDRTPTAAHCFRACHTPEGFYVPERS